PLINEIAEVQATRVLLDECLEELHREGIPVPDSYSLGAMVETPAAAMSAAELARHVDFFSIGTNDLVQYTLAVDRGNSRLSKLYNPFHPGVVRLIRSIVDAGRAADIEVGVCGELAAHPLGAFMLVGMGVHSLSVGPSALAEIKKVIRSTSADAAREAVREALAAGTPGEVVEALTRHARDWIDLTRFSAAWSLSASA
ncbi:MAG: phosphoenolpyruvate--protein phosphotransferase, partial [Gemmatimonadetes bacterium]|nr:phosphoenolpyruvate--protein phosphotransferase [Gemmatimonadota bacterium]